MKRLTSILFICALGLSSLFLTGCSSSNGAEATEAPEAKMQE